MATGGSEPARGLWADYLAFLRYYPRWYLVPIGLGLCVLGYVLYSAGSTSTDAFVYDIF